MYASCPERCLKCASFVPNQRLNHRITYGEIHEASEAVEALLSMAPQCKA
jgi:hypothetical protein